MIILSRNCDIVIQDEQGREKSRHHVPYGAKILVKEGQKVTKGQKVAEWDPFMTPIISEKAGTVKLVDLLPKVTLKSEMDEKTGISSSLVDKVDESKYLYMKQYIKYDEKAIKQQAKSEYDKEEKERSKEENFKPHSKEEENRIITAKIEKTKNDIAKAEVQKLRPSVLLTDAKGKPITFDTGKEVRYYLSPDTVLDVENGSEIKVGDSIARIPVENTKTKDITGGLPRVAELFEARRPKDPAIISDIDGIVEYGKDYKAKQRIKVIDENNEGREIEYLIPKGRRLVVQDGDQVRKGDLLVDGTRAPHDILRVMGVEKLAEYLVQEVQAVYRLQGVAINDKHIEVIVSQMLKKVEITEAGSTTFLVGEQIDRDVFEAENAKVLADGGEPAKADPSLLGITKASLQTIIPRNNPRFDRSSG